MAYISNHPLFRSLGDDEEAEFAKNAMDNGPERPFSWYVYHPVCRRVWLARGLTPPPNADNMGQTPEGPGTTGPETRPLKSYVLSGDILYPGKVLVKAYDKDDAVTKAENGEFEVYDQANKPIAFAADGDAEEVAP